jgi:DNA-binding beta-propeller fold protein YncE
MLTASMLLAGMIPSLAAGKPETGKPEKGAPAQSSAKAPEIRRLATIQDEKGGKLLRGPLALARDDKTGDLIVTSFESSEVVILDRNGAVITRMGKAAGLVSPYGVAVDREGRILVSEIQTGMLKVFSPGGQLLDRIDLSATRGQKVSPGRIMLGPEGAVYVADLTGNQIVVFSPKGDFLRALGPFAYLQKGGPIEGGKVVGVSGQGAAVTVYSAEGKELRTFGEHGGESASTVSFPTGFAVDGRGRLWIADAFQHRLKVFSLDGKFLFNYGRMEETTGGFFFPVDLCFGENGEMFVLEKGANRIQVFQVDDLKGTVK